MTLAHRLSAGCIAGLIASCTPVSAGNVPTPGVPGLSPGVAIPGPTTAPTSAPGTGSFQPTAIQAALKTDAYVRINAAPVSGTSAHSGKLVLYVDKAHAQQYRKGFTGTLPAGATVVKTSEPEGGFLAIMHKQPAGTDPGAGDWLYYETIGTTTVFDGRTTKGGGLCHTCHKQASGTDALLGLDVFPGR